MREIKINGIWYKEGDMVDGWLIIFIGNDSCARVSKSSKKWFRRSYEEKTIVGSVRIIN